MVHWTWAETQYCTGTTNRAIRTSAQLAGPESAHVPQPQAPRCNDEARELHKIGVACGASSRLLRPTQFQQESNHRKTCQQLRGRRVRQGADACEVPGAKSAANGRWGEPVQRSMLSAPWPRCRTLSPRVDSIGLRPSFGMEYSRHPHGAGIRNRRAASQREAAACSIGLSGKQALFVSQTRLRGAQCACDNLKVEQDSCRRRRAADFLMSRRISLEARCVTS